MRRCVRGSHVIRFEGSFSDDVVVVGGLREGRIVSGWVGGISYCNEV